MVVTIQLYKKLYIHNKSGEMTFSQLKERKIRKIFYFLETGLNLELFICIVAGQGSVCCADGTNQQ